MPVSITIVGHSGTPDNSEAEYLTRREQSASGNAWSELDKEFSGTGTEQDPFITSKQVTVTPESGKIEDGSTLDTAKAVAKDAGRGITEVPGQVARGALRALQETNNAIFGLTEWATEKVGDVRMVNGEWRILSPDEAKAANVQERQDYKRWEPINEADSFTGKMVSDVTQFLVGFAGAGKTKLFQALAPVTRMSRAGKAAAQGAAADFTVMDPYEAKLSDLLERNPALSNPVTRYLTANPDDNEAEARFKRSLEGLALGATAEGLFMAVRGLRAARLARAEARVSDPSVAPPFLSRTEARALGDPEGELFTQAKPDPADAKLAAAAKDAEGATPGQAPTGEPDVFINFARINAPEDVQQVIQTMADAQKGRIADAARGVRTWEQTKLSAGQIDAWDTLMSRRAAEPLNAEQSLAARQLWLLSGTKLAEVAKLAAASPSEANLVNFRKMLATHYAIQKEVIAARTETARALNAWKIPAGNDAIVSRNLEIMIEQGGGLEVNRKLAERVAALSERGMTREMEKLVEGSVLARTREAVAQVWINALLSNPATHSVNAISNWGVIAQQMGERRVAAAISDALGTEGGVAAGEAVAQLGGITAGFREALRAALKTAKTGQPQFGLTKLDVGQPGGPGALSAEAWQIASGTPMGRAIDLVDTVSTLPGRALVTSDEFFKSIGYRMELHAQATRQAVQEVREEVISADGLKQRIAEIIENPPENIQLAAADQALYQTFTQRPAETLNRVANAWQNIPVLGILTMPFKRTPINLLTYAAERSPMAPLVRAWREDVAAGGARADLALARVSTGSMMLLAAIDAAMSGDITGKGPTKPAERGNWLRQGNQEYSVRVNIGGEQRLFSYNRLDPIGMTIGMGADIAAAIVNADKKMTDGGDTYGAMEEAIVSSMFAVAKNVTSKTYMSGMAEFFDAVSDSDRYGDRYFERLAGSAVPAGVANIRRQVDPFMRTAQNAVEAMQNRLPFWSEYLPLYRDLWGREVDYRSGVGMAYDIFSPVYTRKYKPEPIDAELQRLEYFPSMPDKNISHNGVLLDLEKNPKAYARYVELAGNELQHPAWGMGAKDFLNAVVTGKHPMSAIYKMLSDGRDGGKASQVQQWMSEYRNMAKEKLLQEFPDLQVEYAEKRNPLRRFDPAMTGR